jgi:hypothetical protein
MRRTAKHRSFAIRKKTNASDAWWIPTALKGPSVFPRPVSPVVHPFSRANQVSPAVRPSVTTWRRTFKIADRARTCVPRRPMRRRLVSTVCVASAGAQGYSPIATWIRPTDASGIRFRMARARAFRERPRRVIMARRELKILALAKAALLPVVLRARAMGLVLGKSCPRTKSAMASTTIAMAAPKRPGVSHAKQERARAMETSARSARMV